jgi:hypothetical protein
MGYLPPSTISDALRRIQRNELILPAIQREYVWKPGQVLRLFDSIMRGYPIGSFLSWRVEPATVKRFRFYGFLRNYNEYDGRHNPGLDVAPEQSVIAMLDGQQRLTSLNVGLRGTYAYKRARAWSNNPDNYPDRTLHLNLREQADENEAGLLHDFRFLTKEQLAATDPDQARFWFPVPHVYEMKELADVWDFAADAGLANEKTARTMLSELWKSVHTSTSVHFYEETDQDVERVLDIFIRVNSAGTVLSYSDLLLSIATAQWKERDARSAIHGLVDALNATGQGFAFTQDVVLKAGLVLAGVGDIGFKVKNFTADNMRLLDQEWDAIGSSLKTAAGLLADFGLTQATLSAGSVLIPIAYYIHHRGLTQKYREAPTESADRALLRSWTLRSLIVAGVWGSGLDSLLRDLRQSIDEQSTTGFPVDDIERRMAARGKSLTITPQQVDDILDLTYGAARTFAVLALMFPHVNTRNIHHVDHIYPAALLSRPRLKQAGITGQAADDLQAKRDRLPNLELLEGSENVSKSDMPPTTWADKVFVNGEMRQAYLDRQAIPYVPNGASDFARFFDDSFDASDGVDASTAPEFDDQAAAGARFDEAPEE